VTDGTLKFRCLRCGTEMDMRDPAPGVPWAPVQYWVCRRCGRHLWTTYPPPGKDKGTGAEDPSAAP
jgi:hypothetical protein